MFFKIRINFIKLFNILGNNLKPAGDSRKNPIDFRLVLLIPFLKSSPNTSGSKNRSGVLGSCAVRICSRLIRNGSVTTTKSDQSLRPWLSQCKETIDDRLVIRLALYQMSQEIHVNNITRRIVFDFPIGGEQCNSQRE